MRKLILVLTFLLGLAGAAWAQSQPFRPPCYCTSYCTPQGVCQVICTGAC